MGGHFNFILLLYVGIFSIGRTAFASARVGIAFCKTAKKFFKIGVPFCHNRILGWQIIMHFLKRP